MAIDVKIKKDLSKLETLIPDIRKEFLANAQRELQELIIDKTIKLGLSPVEGAGKFKRYSDSYKEAIKAGRYKKFGKSISPVNLKLSGNLLDSFFVKRKSNALQIGFDHELADIHTNKGAGKSKVIRKMLPRTGESFKESIMTKIIALLQDAVDRITGKS